MLICIIILTVLLLSAVGVIMPLILSNYKLRQQLKEYQNPVDGRWSLTSRGMEEFANLVMGSVLGALADNEIIDEEVSTLWNTHHYVILRTPNEIALTFKDLFVMPKDEITPTVFVVQIEGIRLTDAGHRLLATITGEELEEDNVLQLVKQPDLEDTHDEERPDNEDD